MTVTLTNNLATKLAAWKAAAQTGLKAGTAAGAAIFEAHAKENAPVLSGRLRDGIHTEIVVDTDAQQQLMVTPVVPASNAYGFDPPYARRIEKGFIGTDSLGRHYHQAPEPYMEPAYDEGKSDAYDALSSGVLNALKGAA